MFDIHIFCDGYYVDIFKAYFIVNNIEYLERDGLVFFVDTVDKFFNIVTGLHSFYTEHSKKGMDSIDFTIGLDEKGGYCVTPVRFAEY